MKDFDDMPMGVYERKMRQPLKDRLLAKIVKDPTSGCWEWIGGKARAGHGSIFAGGGPQRKIATHRASWIVHNGPIPVGMGVLHKCDNPPCCNPDHLFLGTQLDNIRDMIAKGRRRPDIPLKLSDDDIRTIRTMDAKQKDIATMFGISQGCVSEIRARKQRAGVT